MCDSLPPTVDPPDNYSVDNPLRTVGQLVTVFCKNATVAIIKCMPDLKWNATVPSCTLKDTSENMNALLIIVWAIGGVLLFALLILIIIIVTSRSKTPCISRGTSSPSTSVFHISGVCHRNRPGGDNPGFSRADERCGEWSFHRPRPHAESDRLPSYHEAISNNYIRALAREGDVTHQNPPTFVRTSAPPSYRSSQAQNSREHIVSENATAALPHNTSERFNTGTSQITENISSTAGSHIIDNQSTESNQIIENQNIETHQINEDQSTERCQVNQNHSTGNNQGTAQSDTIASAHESSGSADVNAESDSIVMTRRYAESYPQCFFEEDPPPPYSTGSSNCNIYRSVTQQNIRRCNPNWRRSMHAVPSTHTDSRQSENDSQQNQNFRRSMYDRPTNAANPGSLHSSSRQHAYNSSSYQSANAVSNQIETGYLGRRNQEISHPSCRSNFSPSNNVHQYSSVLYQEPTLSNSGSNNNSSHTTVGVHQVPGSSYDSNALQTFPSDSCVPNNSCATQQNYVSTIAYAGSQNGNTYDRTASNGQTNEKKLYVVKRFQATPTAPPFLLNSQLLSLPPHPHHIETQPLCTSTPINQSPAIDRKFIPSSHPSPLPIAHNHHIRGGYSNQEQFIFQRLRAELERGQAPTFSREQNPASHYLPENSQQHPSLYVHSRQGFAPIARLESEFL